MPKKSGPKYRLIATDLQREIRSGNLNPGDQLPTVRELAETYSVTIETVSRAVSYLSERGLVTRRHGSGSYVAGDDDRNLRPRAHTDTVSVLVPTELLSEDDGTQYVTNHWIEAIVSALTRACGRSEVKSQLFGFPSGPIHDPARWYSSLSGACGTVVIGDPHESVLSVLHESNVVTCLINRRPPAAYRDRFFSVVYGTQALRSLAHYVMSLGHRRILFAQDVEPRHNNPVAAIRRTIYEEVLSEWGGIPETDLQTVHVSVDPNHTDLNVTTLTEHLRLGSTAVVCYNDASAIAVYRAADIMKLRIPEDVTVVGHDGLAVSTVLNPSLTTIGYDNHAMCSVVLHTILEVSHGKLPPAEPVEFEGSLLIRRSATVPPAGHRTESDEFSAARQERTYDTIL